MSALFDLAPAPSEPGRIASGSHIGVVGLDLSLTSSGYARIGPSGGAVTGHHGRKGSLKETLQERHERIQSTVDWLNGRWGPSDLVVVEAPSYGSTGGSAWDRAGLWWTVLNQIMPHTTVVVVAPKTRAGWATGAADSGKTAVTAAMRQRVAAVGDDPAGVANNDEADALALAWMGAQWLGWLPATKDEQRRLKSVRWPGGGA